MKKILIAAGIGAILIIGGTIYAWHKLHPNTPSFDPNFEIKALSPIKVDPLKIPCDPKCGGKG